MSETLTTAQAEAIWAILTEECGARSDHGFVWHQTRSHVTEWRFMGTLGFGGKFWRSTSKRPDGTWGELWRVDCYREDATPDRLATIKRANARLWALQSESADV